MTQRRQPTPVVLPVARCGDGVVRNDLAPDHEDFEICDDGNRDETDDCYDDCTPRGCGDGILAGGEVCDDGNEDSNDGCPASCRPARCGDGYVRTDVGELDLRYEQCDDGNDADLPQQLRFRRFGDEVTGRPAAGQKVTSLRWQQRTTTAAAVTPKPRCGDREPPA